MYKLNKLLL